MNLQSTKFTAPRGWSLFSRVTSSLKTRLGCALVALLACSGVSASTEKAPSCTAEGAFGIRFGDKISSTEAPPHSIFFGKGCYRVSPPNPGPFFDIVAACVSEFDGKVYLIQALKLFDNKTLPGAVSLTPEQVASNRKRGKQALASFLEELPKSVSAPIAMDDKADSWQVDLEGGVFYEVSNYPSWALTFECRHKTMMQQVFRRRLQG